MQREGDLPQYLCANVMLSSGKIVSRGIGQRTVQEQEETALSTMKIEVVAPSGAKALGMERTIYRALSHTPADVDLEDDKEFPTSLKQLS